MPPHPQQATWKVSLHGGHSSEFCDHAASTLREILDAAVRSGFHTYGVTEHAPRHDARYLYPEEIEMGWDVNTLLRNFEAYAALTERLVGEYEGRLEVLRGFEAEVVPAGQYQEIMLGYRERFGFDYVVGSVHYVNGRLFDGRSEFHEIVASQGGLEAFVLRYYEEVVEMVEALRPEVVAHLDVYRKFGKDLGPAETPAIRKAAGLALEALRDRECILDVNLAGYRKGLATPYPEPWLLQLARDLGVEMCFGDDSHCAGDVGAFLDEGRAYLLEHGVRSLTLLRREAGGLVKKKVPLL